MGTKARAIPNGTGFNILVTERAEDGDEYEENPTPWGILIPNEEE